MTALSSKMLDRCWPRNELVLALNYSEFPLWLARQRIGSCPETLVLYRMRPSLDAKGLFFLIGGAADTAV